MYPNKKWYDAEKRNLYESFLFFNKLKIPEFLFAMHVGIVPGIYINKRSIIIPDLERHYKIVVPESCIIFK